MTEEELRLQKIERFGYDPSAKLEFVGLGPADKYEYYFNAQTGNIEVCNEGCNGTWRRGRLRVEDGREIVDLPDEMASDFLETLRLFRETSHPRRRVRMEWNPEARQFEPY